MTKQKMSRGGAHGEGKKNGAFGTQTKEKVKWGRGMRARETSGITEKYTGIEIDRHKTIMWPLAR